MGNKILNQLYHSCNVTWVMPCKNTSFLKLWPCEVLTTHDCSMACCCMLFGKKSGFATHTPLKTWSQISQYLLLYPKPEMMLLLGILVPQGCYRSVPILLVAASQAKYLGSSFSLTPICMPPYGCRPQIHVPQVQPRIYFCTSCLTHSTFWKGLIALP